MRLFAGFLACAVFLGCSSSSDDAASSATGAGAGGSGGVATGGSGGVATGGNSAGGEGGAPGGASGSGGDAGSSGGGDVPGPPWQSGNRILVPVGPKTGVDCRVDICKHSENTDLIRWNGAIWLVHRTAKGQVLGPDSSLQIYRSDDDGATFTKTAVVEAPQGPITPTDTGTTGRDLRDPCFYIVGDKLFIKGLARLPVTSTRDSNVDSMSVWTSTSDGITWTPLAPMTDSGWSIWRIKQENGVYYGAAYADGDASTALFSSTDGMSWTKGAIIYDNAAETPLEPQVVFMPSGKLLVYMRNDGNDAEILGGAALTTRVCWSDPPYATFDCPSTFMGERLDGPVDFVWQDRLFVIARRHLGADLRKRTSLFEITGTLEGGPIDIKEWGDFPSAGDTAYAGVVARMDGSFLVSWYSSDLALDPDWASAIGGPTAIWRSVIDLTKLQ